MEIKKNKRDKIIFICWIIFLVYWGISSVINNCGLYADGSYSVFEILNKKGLWLWYPARRCTMALTRIFVIIFMKMNITNFVVLIKAYSLGCVVWTILFVILASYFFYEYDTRRMLEINICVWGLIIVFTGLYCMHESLLTTAISWLQFSYICYYDKITSKFLKFFCIVVSLISILGTHESYAILSVCLILFGVIQWHRVGKKGDFCFYLILFLIFIGGIYEVYGGVVGNDTSKMGFLTSIKYVDRMTVIWFVILIAYVTLFSLLRYKERVDKIRQKVEVILSLSVVIFLLKNTDIIVHDTRYIRPLLHIIIPGGIILLTIFTGSEARKGYNYFVSIISKVTIVAATASITLIGWGYSNYLSEIWNNINSREGFVEWDNSNKENVYNTDWTIPFESIIAQKIHNENRVIESIAVQPQSQIYYQPFNMWNIDEYYDLTEFGVNIDKSKFENVFSNVNDINFNIKLLDCKTKLNRQDDVKLNIEFELDSSNHFKNLNQYSLSYHIYDEEGNLLIWDGDRTSFPEYYDGYKLQIDIPEMKTYQSGRYLVKLDIVQEGVCWLSEKNVEMPSKIINIQ